MRDAIRRFVLRTRIALLRWHIDCLVDERLFYRGAGLIGPEYMRASCAEQRRLQAKVDALEARL